MTHVLSGVRVRTLTINRDDIFGHFPSPLSISPCLDMTSFGNVLLLKIGMTHPLSILRVRTVTINSGDIAIRTC